MSTRDDPDSPMPASTVTAPNPGHSYPSNRSFLWITDQAAIGLGIAGILGSIVLFIGDMLFFYNSHELDYIENLGAASPEKVIWSAICALVSTWLYVLGSGQVHYALRPAKPWLRRVVFLSFLAIMISYGIVHAAYVAIATSVWIGVAIGLPPDSYVGLPILINDTLRSIAYVPFGIFTVFFTLAIWQRKSYYPRWFLVFHPLVPFVLRDWILSWFDGDLLIILSGGYLNLILLVFFFSSTVVLKWRKRST